MKSLSLSLSLFLLLSLTSPWADAGGQMRVSDACWDGGGEVPGPFAVNQHAELADGENYLLTGKVSMARGLYYLEIDLSQNGWLASKQRRNFPYYQLEGDSSYWSPYVGQRIRIACIAHGRIILTEAGTTQYEISLVPVGNHVQVIKPKRDH